MTSQAPHAIRTVLALVAGGAGLPIYEQNIRVKTHDIGGGFGGKVPVYPGYVLAVAASFLTGKPVKWIEDRSENLQADSFARDYHIHAELGATKEGKITCAQGQDHRRPRLHGRRRRSVQVPGRPVQRHHRQLRLRQRLRRSRRRLHQQAARRRRLSLLVPRDRGGPRHRADGRHPGPRHRQGSGPAPDGELHPARAVPVQDARRAGSTTRATIRPALQMAHGHDRLRRASQGAGSRSAPTRRAHGHRHLQLHRDRRCRALARLRHPGPEDVRRRRDPGPPDRQGPRPDRVADARARATRRRSPRSSPRSSASRSRTSRSNTATRTRRPMASGPTASRSTPDVRRLDRHGVAQDPGQGADPRGAPARGVRGGPRVGARQVQRQGLTGPLQDDPGDRLRGLHQLSRRDGRWASRRSTTTIRPISRSRSAATSASWTSTRAPAGSISAGSWRSTTAATSSTR